MRYHDTSRRRVAAWRSACLQLLVLLTWSPGLASGQPNEGAAPPPAEHFKSVFEFVWAGGWVEAVILLASVAAFVAIVDCWLRTRLSVAVPTAFLSEVRRRLAGEDAASLVAFCSAQRSLIAEALRIGFRRASEGLAVMEAGAYQALEEGLTALQARLTLPVGVAVTAPLLGLLGAVLRLIGIFGGLMSPSPPAGAEVARDIVAALVPLGTGLLVSVIVTAFCFYLRRRIAKVGIAASVPLREVLEEARQRERGDAK